jgi:hypothetical protein
MALQTTTTTISDVGAPNYMAERRGRLDAKRMFNYIYAVRQRRFKSLDDSPVCPSTGALAKGLYVHGDL